MNANITKRNELLAQKVIKGLESRNMTGYYAADKEAALQQALCLIPEGSTITMGGGMSVHEIGLSDALKKGNYNFIDRDHRRKCEQGVRAGAGTPQSDHHRRNEQGLRRCGWRDEEGEKCRGADQCAEVRAGHALRKDRLLHELQVSGYDLLPVPDHTIFQASRKNSRDPCE